MIGVDKSILYIATEIDKPITNLQLQKIWYFSIGYLIKNNNMKSAMQE